MLLEKIRKFFPKYKKYLPIFLILLFSVLFFSTRLLRLKNDIINPDGSLWHYRSEQFIVGIKNKQFEKTYQHYQPGVTLMWVTGSAVEIYKQITGITSYDVSNFQTFDLVSKVTLVAVQFLLSVFLIFLLSKVVGFYKSFFVVSFFTFEPFFLANSRLYHMDVLLTLLLMISITLAFINLKKPEVWRSVLIGFFLSLSFLTKSISIGALIFVIFYTVVYFFYTKQKEKIFPVAGTVIISFAVFTFALFPALWVRPAYYLKDMFSEVSRVGIRKGHDQIVFGKPTNNAGLPFYPLVTLMKVSPFLLIGVLSCAYHYIKSTLNVKKSLTNRKNLLFVFSTYLLIFFLGYMIGISLPSKKIDRYILVVFPFLSYCAVVGYQRIFQNLKSSLEKTIFAILFTLSILSFLVRPVVRLFPWYFTYTSPLFGSAENANKIIGQKPFGVGIPDLKDIIVDRYSKKYGEAPKLGFYDTQPMKSIYPNSRVFDVRVYGPSNYDLLILAVNEEMPEKVLDAKDFEFEKDYSLWINGLEYWRIYVRKSLPEV